MRLEHTVKYSTIDKYKGLIKLMRPKQWIKNVFVLAALIFSKKMFDVLSLKEALFAFILFCGISSSVYIINDIADLEKDRKHPKKRFRPLPSGLVKKRHAAILFFILALASLILSFLINANFGIIVLSYFIINLAYTFYLKNIIIIDVMVIAVGFVLRVIAGAEAIGVASSPWLLLCTLLLSLFLAITKRKNEVIVLDNNAKSHRNVLDEYSVKLLDNMLSIVTSSTIIAYSLYTFYAEKGYYMMITILFVIYGIFRYQYLVDSKTFGGSPELAFFEDKPFLINGILYCITVILILYI
ncbi:decaprenyl-phosphate phosphoribosyltransferase [Thermoanaerobacterium thermosaccharolyticum]|uniref:UbiA prenyltransferase n=1 Tax=Thermoanaerobacterium thermosaccharolyticum (strain ATCC 7956 / DSM 571 / NCIMB 9385 / NCA 3814 / NCTC 13789 / WDCM 00135 / 2032) TaxID=580327 RepID=D9TLU0_THETC|nr:decaprenyl-phosphate phosphoribosyltransferase [Thermoanaerobacterium thermosaccharolyticum]ADL70020.1 UbiA prenyltransferase [Thermoanaerobacterium thermosaccharolyticum DSM 571]KAA5806005.1 decaprenyl-phosphate phosphoribosyltransferase [Thermoanaerobacterium thermosaccharolyticum]